MPIDVCLVIDELLLPNHSPLEFTDYNPCDMPRTMGSEYRHRVIRIDVTFHSSQCAFYWVSSDIHEELISYNNSQKGVRTIHKAKVYTSF